MKTAEMPAGGPAGAAAAGTKKTDQKAAVLDLLRETGLGVAELSLPALRELQEAMRGEAEKAGLTDDEEIVKLCREVRREMRRERHARNA